MLSILKTLIVALKIILEFIARNLACSRFVIFIMNGTITSLPKCKCWVHSKQVFFHCYIKSSCKSKKREDCKRILLQTRVAADRIKMLFSDTFCLKKKQINSFKSYHDCSFTE